MNYTDTCNQRTFSVKTRKAHQLQMHRLLLVLFLFASHVVMAQTQGDVKVNIHFNPVQVITINPSQNTINIEYNTIEQYHDGVENHQKGHLTLFSTSAYEVSVRTRTPQFTSGLDELSVSNLSITATLPQGNINGISFSSIQVDESGKKIISSTRPSLETTFDITYKGAGNPEFMDRVVNGAPTVYSAEVIYTISSK